MTPQKPHGIRTPSLTARAQAEPSWMMARPTSPSIQMLELPARCREHPSLQTLSSRLKKASIQRKLLSTTSLASTATDGSRLEPQSPIQTSVPMPTRPQAWIKLAAISTTLLGTPTHPLSLRLLRTPSWPHTQTTWALATLPRATFTQLKNEQQIFGRIKIINDRIEKNS